MNKLKVMADLGERMRGNWNILILISIIALSFFLRVYKIADNPPALNWDEVSHGYNAYSLLKTGRDEWGTKLPLIFRAYGDYKLPLYIYLSVLPLAFFGLGAFSVRLVSLLSGTGLVFLAYLITKKLTKNEAFSLLATFLTAISPWGLFVSRVAVEANLGAFLFALGMYFFLGWLKREEGKLFWTTLSWGLALFAYNSARVIVPVFFLFLLIMGFWKKRFKELVLPTALFLVFLIPFIGQLYNQTAKARFDWVSLIDQGTLAKIIEKRNTSPLPSLITRALYNRPAYFIAYAARNYLASFSPKYLFFRGGSHYQFSQPGHELLYLVTAPFLLLGLLRAIFRGRLEEELIAGWFLLAFLPSAITRDAPHVLRSLFVLPTPMILTVIGLKTALSKISGRSRFKGRLLFFILCLAVAVSFGRWWQDYWQIYRPAYSWAWQYGYQEAVLMIKENYQQYDRIFFSKRYGEPHEFIAFYWGWKPKSFQDSSLKEWDYHANWYWVNKLDKIVFVNDWEVKYRVECGSREKCLLITSPGNFPKHWQKIKTINFLDGKPAFEIFEN
jgi:4-amino-4-deoxy-L-arabinose transferase-like glycosyltransferase